MASTAEDRAGPALPVWATVAALVLIVALTAAGATTVVASADEAARARAESEAARTGIELRGVIAEVLVAVDALRPPPGIPLILGQADAEGEPTRPFAGAELLGEPGARTALARARDSGSIAVSRPLGTSTVLVVRARYDGVPRSVTDRRRALVGYTVGVVAAPSLLPPDAAGERRITDGAEVLVPFTEPPARAAEATVPVLDRHWVVAAPVEDASSAAPWLIVFLGAVAGFLVLVAHRAWSAAAREAARAASRADARAEAVVTYAGVVQESHDIGRVVPALTVELSDRLEIAGLSLSVATGPGYTRDVFTFGEPPDRSVASDAALPSTAVAGQTLAVHLRRAERSIGVLRVRCGADLGAADLDQLRVAAELMTSTVVAARSLEQQQDAVDRLRALDDLKTAFLGTASHELRTPVTAIAGFSFMLTERWDALTDRDRRLFAERIASNARALEALVQDLLDFARLERGELRLVLERVDPAVVASRVLDRLEPVWPSHQIERSMSSGGSVTADVGALERVVTNLVSNAAKFSPEGSTIRVSVEHDDRDVRLVVDDQGPGVPLAERDRIFVRFYRGEGENVLRASGVGIGLSVVKDFVDRMGGMVEVSDSPEGGARFTVRFAPTTERSTGQETSDVAST